MSERKNPAGLPETRLVKARSISVVWAVPAVAALLVAALLWQSFTETGPRIRILFEDGSGIRQDQTVLKYRGVAVGRVAAVRLGPEQRSVQVEVELDRSAAGLAREGSRFWIVRPEIGLEGVRGLDTLVSGPYIQALPGEGERSHEFTGLEHPPADETGGRGLEVRLRAPRLGAVKAGSPIYFRDVEVGRVTGYGLAGDATAVMISARIAPRYARLVRIDSRFWVSGGLSVGLSLFGAEVSTSPIESLLSGGIAFASPDAASEPAPAGHVFEVAQKPDAEWLEWAPPLLLTPPR